MNRRENISRSIFEGNTGKRNKQRQSGKSKIQERR